MKKYKTNIKKLEKIPEIGKTTAQIILAEIKQDFLLKIIYYRGQVFALEIMNLLANEEVEKQENSSSLKN